MLDVTVLKYTGYNRETKKREYETSHKAVFVGLGVEAVEGNDGSMASETCAVCLHDGQIELISLHLVRFDDPKALKDFFKPLEVNHSGRQQSKLYQNLLKIHGE